MTHQRWHPAPFLYVFNINRTHNLCPPTPGHLCTTGTWRWRLSYTLRKPGGKRSQTACTGLQTALPTLIQAPLVFPSGVSQKSLGESEFKGKVFQCFLSPFFGACIASLCHAFHPKRFMHSFTESLQTDDLKIRLIKLQAFLPHTLYSAHQTGGCPDFVIFFTPKSNQPLRPVMPIMDGGIPSIRSPLLMPTPSAGSDP